MKKARRHSVTGTGGDLPPNNGPLWWPKRAVLRGRFGPYFLYLGLGGWAGRTLFPRQRLEPISFSFLFLGTGDYPIRSSFLEYKPYLSLRKTALTHAVPYLRYVRYVPFILLVSGTGLLRKHIGDKACETIAVTILVEYLAM